MSGTGNRGRFSLLERKLLDEVHRTFPVCSRPYAALGERVGCTEQQACDTIQSLRQRGFIRRIGGIFDSRALGYVSELVVMKVPRERLEEVAQVVNEYHGVTHNYEREGDYNLWFTISQERRSELDRILADIRSRTNIKEMLRLPASRKFKVEVILPLGK